MKELFANRLKRARIMAGFSMDKLALSIGVSKEAINKYEKAKAQPDSTKLIKICNALNVNIDYFFRKETFEMEGIEFRKKSKLGARKIEQLKERIKDKLERYLELEELMAITNKFNNPIEELNINSMDDVEIAALKVRDIWKLGMNPIGNIVELFEDFGIKVIEADEALEFDGLSAIINGNIPLVVVNKNFTIERKRFTLMHELGHLLLKLPDNTPNKQEEAFCNRFAGAILMPKEKVLDEIGLSRKHFYMNEIAEIQKEWGLSIQAILYRAKDVGIVTSYNMQSFYKQYNSNRNFKEGVDQVRYVGTEESGRFNQLLFRALAQELISTGKAAALSNQSISEIKTAISLM